MTYNPDIHHRRSIRLRGYDYSRHGAYYVTVCIQGHKCLLGEIALGQMNQNDAGRLVEQAWKWIPRQFPTAEMDEHIVMPNHFHGILRIAGAPRMRAGQINVRPQRAPPGKRGHAQRSPLRKRGHPQGVPLRWEK
jgi:hypothetical protein